VCKKCISTLDKLMKNEISSLWSTSNISSWARKIRFGHLKIGSVMLRLTDRLKGHRSRDTENSVMRSLLSLGFGKIINLWVIN
jgi:hypothetical protein